MNRVLLGVVVLMAACSLAACGSGSSGQSSTEASQASEPEKTTAGADLSGQTATFVTFGGAETKPIYDAFAAPVASETGLDLTLDEPTSYTKVQTQVETENVSWTVVQADPWWSLQECGNLLEEVPAAVDLSEIDSQFLVGHCEVPGDTFSPMIAYDPADFGSDPPTSWADFFDTSKFPGKRGVWGSYAVNGALEGALLADGVLPEKLYPLNLNEAYEKLDDLRSNITFYDTLAQSEEMMVNHEVSMILLATNTSGWGANSQGAEYKPVWNEALLGYDAYVVPKGANTEAAAAILNRIASPAAQKEAANKLPVGQTVKSPAQVTCSCKTLKEWSLSEPAHLEALVPLDQQYYATHYEEVSSLWTEWVAGG